MLNNDKLSLILRFLGYSGYNRVRGYDWMTSWGIDEV
jgi:hypothetical protein